MPLYRHTCDECGTTTLDLLSFHDPNPVCCGFLTTRLMPKRVIGWVDTGNHVSKKEAGEAMLSVIEENQRKWDKKIDPNDPYAMPSVGNWKKDYAQCTAAERDARWADTHQAMTAWTTRCLERDGLDKATAEQKAKEVHTKTIEKAREANTRADGLT